MRRTTNFTDWLSATDGCEAEGRLALTATWGNEWDGFPDGTPRSFLSSECQFDLCDTFFRCF